MKLHRIIIVLILTLILAGCAPSPLHPPAISDIRESIVKVQANTLEQIIYMDAVREEATKGCALYKKTPKPISERCVSFTSYNVCRVKEYIFACFRR